MNKRTFIAAAVTLLAGVQTAWAQPVTRTVTVTTTPAGQITVDYPVLTIPGRGQSTIRFELNKGSGFSFTEKGIDPIREVVSATDLRDRGDGANQKEVGPCQRIENGRAMNCPNRHTRDGVYKYTINLLGPDGKPISKDPIIVNQ